MSILALIRGIPGSGKSTFAKTFIENGFFHFEADMYHCDEDGTYKFDINNLYDAHRWCERNVTSQLLAGNDVVVSNTFTTFKEMRSYVEFVIEHDHKLVVHTMTKEYGSIHDVPEETMTKMINRFQSHEVIMKLIEG